MFVEADLAIIWGAREITSLIGISIIVISHWYYGRKWDEEGYLAYETALEEIAGADYAAVDENGQPTKKFVTLPDGSRDAISVATEDNREAAISVPPSALEKAMPIPYATIVGIITWAVSFLFQPGRIAKLYVGWNIPFLMFLPVIAVLLGFHVRKTTIERNLDYKKRALTIVLAMCIFLVIAGICEKKTDAPWYFCVFGALLLFFSYHTMRRARKMGITWEQEGKPASEVASQHFGAMTLILAFYFIWVGTNGIAMDGVVGSYVPIFMDYRAWLVFVAAFGIIVPSSMALDFAFDQGSKPIPLAFGDMYKLDGRTCREIAGRFPYFSAGPIGEWMETPWPLFGGWMLFGLCAFMPFGNGASFQKTMAFIICCMIGVVYTARLLPAYWNRDAGYKRWTYFYYAGMVFLFTAIGVDGQGPLVASMVGAILVLLGQHVELFEKKKGKYWIQQGEDSPRPEVAYSIGHPVYVLGWLLLCLGMSIPML